MIKNKKIFVGKAGAILSLVPALIYGLATGPEPRNTGAPGDQKTCFRAGCHSGTRIESSTAIKLDVGSQGLTYTPGGEKQRWTVTIEDPLGVVFGFQLTARPSANLENGQAGDFIPIDTTTQVLCDDGSVKTAAQPCGPAATVQFIEHTMPNPGNIFRFDWTPPATDVGNVHVYVAANAANGNGQNTGDRIHTAGPFILTPAAAGMRPSISQAGVVNAWSFRSTIADATWISIFGQNLAPGTRGWRQDDFVDGKLPRQLDGVGVKVNGKDAFINFISPGQVNALAPSDGALGTVSVQLTGPQGASNLVTVTKQAVAPALFTWFGVPPDGEKFVGAVAAQDGAFIGRPGLLQQFGITTRPAKPDEFVLLFATGCGETNPPVPDGEIVNPPVPRLASPVAVRIGGLPAEVFDNTGFLIFAGECQFNVKIPGSAPDGDLQVGLEIGGMPAQQDIRITVQK